MTLAGEGWRRDFGIVTLTAQLSTVAACAYIIARYPQHRVLQGRDLLMARITVLAQLCFLDHSWQEIWGGSWLPCPAFFFLHTVGVPIYLASQICNGVRLLHLFEFNELKAATTQKRRLSDGQTQRLKQLQRLLTSKFIALRFVAICTVDYAAVTIVFFASGRPYDTNNVSCMLTAPPWDSQASIMTRTYLDPMYIALFAIILIGLPPVFWTAWQLRKHYLKGATESLGIMRELLISTAGLVTTFCICTVIIYSDYKDYATTYNWIQLPALSPMCCALYFVVLPTINHSALTKRIKQYLHRHQVSLQPTTTTESTLQAALHDKLGFQYLLLQCRSEFSEENIVALKAIWQFQAAPSFPSMLEIYEAFIEDGAVLQVNISNAARDKVAELVHSYTAASLPSDMQKVFAEVEIEVTKLVENNSWVRFKQSPMYQRYIDGELPPNVTQLNMDTLSRMPSTKRMTLGSRLHPLMFEMGDSTPDPLQIQLDGASVGSTVSKLLTPVLAQRSVRPSTTASPPSNRTTSKLVAGELPAEWRIPAISYDRHGYDLPMPTTRRSSTDLDVEAEVDAFCRPGTRAGRQTLRVNMDAHKRTTLRPASITASPEVPAEFLSVAPLSPRRSIISRRSSDNAPVEAPP